MGCDIFAYYDVNQREINDYIHANHIDLTSYTLEQSQQLTQWFRERHIASEDKVYSILYHWNEKCDMHKLWSYYGTNFIRDDERFQNKRYHRVLAEKLGRPFPSILHHINWNVRTREDAKEVARELRVFFAADRDLIEFADWLDATAKYCSTYELSY